MKQEDYVIELSTSVKRPKIKIDGAVFELAMRSDLDFSKLSLLERAGEIGGKLASLSVDDVAQKDLEEVTEYLDRVTRAIVLKIDNRTLRRLSSDQKVQILRAFIATVELGTGGPRKLKVGQASSPSSSDSTAATQEAG